MNDCDFVLTEIGGLGIDSKSHFIFLVTRKNHIGRIIMKMFSKTMTVNEFRAQYWYKTELQKICRKYSLPTYGTKAELQEYIERFLKGEQDIEPRRTLRRKKDLSLSEITLDTKILESGFSLNNVAREWFRNYYDVDKFSFNKSMAIKMREIEENHDVNATVADLVKAHDSNNKIVSKEEKTYQWNQFVKDFNSDSFTKKFKNKRLKVASLLWKYVKDSEKADKVYHHSLLKKYQSEINDLIKREEKSV